MQYYCRTSHWTIYIFTIPSHVTRVIQYISNAVFVFLFNNDLTFFIKFHTGVNICRLFIMFLMSYNSDSCWMIYIFTIPSHVTRVIQYISTAVFVSLFNNDLIIFIKFHSGRKYSPNLYVFTVIQCRVLNRVMNMECNAILQPGFFLNDLYI